MHRSALPTLALALLLAACGDTDGPGDKPGGDGGSDGGTDGGATGDGGDGGAPATEQDCDDGIDDDGDGSPDCLDDDCASAWQCNLPDQIDFRTQLDFRGNTIECEAFGIEFDVDIEDCQSDGAGTLDWIEGGPQTCPDCDRTYRGMLTYSVDSCSEMLGESLPPDAIYGFVFLDEFNRELWAPDVTTGKWYFIERMTSDNGRQWVIEGSDAIIMDPEDCDNGDQNLGTLSVALTWVDR